MYIHSLWRVRSYIRPYLGSMATMVFAAVAGLVAAMIIPLVTRGVIDGPIADGRRQEVLPLAALALALGLVEGGTAMLRRHVLAHAATGLETDLRNDFYAHLQRLPVEFHDGWQSGQLLSRAMTDISVIRRFVGFGLVFLVVNTLTFIAVVALLVSMHVWLGLLCAASAVPIVLLSRRFERDYGSVSRRLQDQEGDLTTLVEEAATGIRVIKAFGRHQLVGARFASATRSIQVTALEQVRLRGRFWAVLGLVPNLTMAGVLLGGGLAVSRGTLTLGGLVAFVSLLLLLVWPVEALGEILAMAEEAATAASRVFEVLDTTPAIADHRGAVDLPRCEGHLQFEGVTFAYPGTEHAVLHAVNLDVQPGETLALVGITGSGKTTLTALVPRLYDPTEGRVTIDGHDVRDLRLSSLRRHVAVAFEDPTLFSASVRENLRLGCPEATDADIEAALDVASAGFVHELPWGLDTRVGEQGLSLSGGQRQRLALARAIIGRPAVLVLDDPLSALDVHTEAAVEDALRRVLAGTTALLVVHRPSTLALADRVALIDGGTITRTGTHAELMATSPTYRAILSQEADQPEEVQRERRVS